MNEKTISQLETLHNKIYKETEEYGRTQFVSRIVDLEHNWNELKKWMNSEIERFEDNPYTRLGIAVFTKVLDKMQELEEGGNND